MKTFSLVFAFVLAVAFAAHAPIAEAKRLGGGKSFGQSYRTAPAASMAPAAPRQQPGVGAVPGQPGRGLFGGGMMGGVLGGLLAGGLLGAMLGGGFHGFEGIQFLDILLIGGIGYFLFRMLRARASAGPMPVAAAYRDLGPVPGEPERSVFDVPHIGRDGTGTASPAPFVTGGGFGADSVPFNFPPGFNQNSFLLGAREHYREVQVAWNANDFAKLGEYLAPALVEEVRAERDSLGGDQHTEVLFVDAEIVRADLQGNLAELSVKFTGSYRDKVENVEEPFTDLWHLARDTTTPAAPWLIVGIESA